MPSNKVILSVAGSGKTYTICEQARSNSRLTEKRILLLTYTNRGRMAIEKEYRKQNDGIIDYNIEISTWYKFLLNDMIKPYQSYILKDYGLIKTLDFTSRYGEINYNKIGTKQRYLCGSEMIKSEYASEMCVETNKGLEGTVIERLEKIYSHIYIDELQDYVGYDLEIFKLLIDSSIEMMFVGDHKQATFSTHNTTKHKPIAGRNVQRFVEDMEKKACISVEKNVSSRRCNNHICSFANLVYPSSICMESCCFEVTNHDGVFLITDDDLEVYFNEYNPTFLRNNKNSGYDTYVPMNYGECKGDTYERVVIVPTSPFLDFIRKGRAIKSPDKYYVAVTRAKYSVAIVVKELIENEKFKKVLIKVGNEGIIMSMYTWE